MRRLIILTALLVIGLAAVPTAQAKVVGCGDVRVNQKLKDDKKALFGAFKIRQRGSSCAVARKIAYKYVHDRKAPSRKPFRAYGWACTARGKTYQQYAVSCVRPHVKGQHITFTDVVPGG